MKSKIAEDIGDVTENPAELRKVMRPDLGVALIDLDRSGA